MQGAWSGAGLSAGRFLVALIAIPLFDTSLAYYGFPIGLVLGRVSMLIGAGIVVGLAIGTWASRFRATLLSGLDPRDPATLLASVVTLAVVSALAGWLPATGHPGWTRPRSCGRSNTIPRR